MALTPDQEITELLHGDFRNSEIPGFHGYDRCGTIQLGYVCSRIQEVWDELSPQLQGFIKQVYKVDDSCRPIRIGIA